MSSRSFRELLLLLVFLEVIVSSKCKHSQNAAASDFLHQDFDLVEDLIISEETTINNRDTANLIFQPSILDFLQRSIGDPHNQIVILFNKHKNRSVYLGSISGSSPDFYSSYFEEKVIPPSSNTTFNVVFLPRQLGESYSSLLIHTSFGIINYHVKGIGDECPYRLRPLIGLRAPLNSTITPEILLYNPHPTPLQIVEVYSSGGDFQLELPGGGGQEGDYKLWQIPPHSTKAIIRVRYFGKTPGNHTAYVRIKVSGTDEALADKMLVVPIEIEILNHTGIYSKIPILDFGIVGSSDGKTKHSLYLLNSGKKFVDIKSWGIDTKDELLLQSSSIMVEVQRSNRNDNAADRLYVEVVWSQFPEAVTFVNGSFFVTTESTDDNSLEQNNQEIIYRIPFFGKILRGGLDYKADQLNFLSSDKKIYETPRHFILTSKFNVPLAITNLTVPEMCSQHFTITGFKPVIVQPGAELWLLDILPSKSLNATSNSTNSTISVETFFKLTTNISSYEFTLLSYNGMLRRIVPLDHTANGGIGNDERALNFGTLPISKQSELLLAFVNDNPMTIAIPHWRELITSGTGAATISVTVRGCSKLSLDNLVFCNKVKQGEWIVFGITVNSNVAGYFQGKFVVKTDFEEIITPIKFSTAMGRLELKRELLAFNDCFPGKICSLNLSAYSTFIKKMLVEGISVDMDGISYEFKAASNEEYPEILPNHVTDIGKLYFNPRDICKQNCYTSFDLLAKAHGVKWMQTVHNYSVYSKLDNERLLTQLGHFIEVKQSFKSISFRLTTSQIRRHEFDAEINFIWPRLLSDNIEFPFVQVNRVETRYIEIVNPSDQLLFIHFVLHDTSIHGNGVELLPEALRDCPNCVLSQENVFAFNTNNSEIYVQDVKPQSQIKLGISFLARTPGTYSTVLYMRNNLTVVEAVWVTARAVVPQFKFGNRRPGSQTSLMFEIGDKHLKLCDKIQTEANVLITSKRSFTAKNHGEVPITIRGIKVENDLCEGYGFKVLNCAPLQLQPNESKKIEIAFSPDFTLARVVRTLNFDTSIGYAINFTLLGTVPAHALEPCSRNVMRPQWEHDFKRNAVMVLTVALIFVVMAAFFDADKILKEHFRGMSRFKGPVQPTLDLRHLDSQFNSGDTEWTYSPNSSLKKRSQCNGHVKKGNGYVNGFNLNKKAWTEFKNKLTGVRNSTKPVESKKNSPKSASGSSSSKDMSRKVPDKKLVEDDSVSTSSKENCESTTASSKTSNSSADGNNSHLTSSTYNKNNKNSGKKSKNQPIEAKKEKSIDIKTPLTNSNSNGKVKEPKAKVTPLQPVVAKPNGDVKSHSPIAQIENHYQFDQNLQNINPGSNLDPQQKKYVGKTPGRERKPTIKKLPIKLSTCKTNLQFGSCTARPNNMTNQPISPNSWTSTASFSDVVAHSPTENKPKAKPTFESISNNGFGVIPPSNYLDNFFTNQNSYNSINNIRKSMFVEPLSNPDNVSPIDLGPIGTKKSPSSTPNWESLSNHLPRPTPIAPPSTSNPNSLFSDAHYLNNYSNNIYSNGGQSKLFEQYKVNPNDNGNSASSGSSASSIISGNNSNMSMMNENFSRYPQNQMPMQHQAIQKPMQQPKWDNELYLELLKKDEMRAQMNGWGSNNYWSPSIYQTTPVTTSTMQMPPSNWSSTSAAPLRPPPGLYREQDNRSVGSNLGGAGNMTNSTQLAQMLFHQQQQAAQMQANRPNEQNDEQPPAYDPFKSLSAIWERTGTDSFYTNPQ